MSTHAITFIHDTDEKSPVLTAIYTQFDGYFEGHGDSLFHFLKNMEVVNGLPLGNVGKMANGMGCLAAQLISHLKKGPGNHYILPSDTEDTEEFMYRIFLKGGKIHLNGMNVRSKEEVTHMLPVNDIFLIDVPV